MNQNPEIEMIVNLAVEIATEKKHEYVLTEHLLLATVRHRPFRHLLENFGVDVDLMDADIETYLNG